MPGKVYIVATPIGNLSDITLRGIETLKSVDVIFAEDTRKTRNLLERYEIDTQVNSYHAHSQEKNGAISVLLEDGQNIALVTDAGTPGISDPGNELINFLVSQMPNIQVVPIPGASSVVSALSVSGFDSNKFTFLGFWPKKGRQKTLTFVKESSFTVVFFESPFRIKKTLGELAVELGEDRRICVCREMTKIYETVYRGNISEVSSKLSGNVKGELVVVIEGK